MKRHNIILFSTVGVLAWVLVIYSASGFVFQPRETAEVSQERANPDSTCTDNKDPAPDVDISDTTESDDPIAEAPPSTPEPNPRPPASGDSSPATNSAGLLRLANRDNYLGNYTPIDLITGVQGFRYRQIMDADLRAMINSASQDSVSLTISSAFRSRAHQTTLWNNGVANHGLEWANRWIARPGHSEHQLGLAIDFAPVAMAFGQSPAGIWVRQNSWRYGFILRYTEENQHITGFNYEPWHFRYIGRANARLYHETGARSLEEFVSAL
ncbi:M15 family metallopeptidase [Candidatus Saccharibacteria bacterium]|nr:M15 family metallopeptidase [Candidatus Saccharibacteria bacterium]